jgi:hypothetical protein
VTDAVDYFQMVDQPEVNGEMRVFEDLTRCSRFTGHSRRPWSNLIHTLAGPAAVGLLRGNPIRDVGTKLT